MPLSDVVHAHSKVGLEAIGLGNLESYVRIHWNLNPSELIELAIINGEGHLTDKGALRVLTGQYTGRSPKDKYFVEEPSTKDELWWGEVNRPVSQEIFNHLRDKAIHHLSHSQHLYVLDAFAGTDPKYRLPIRLVSEVAYHALFAWNMFVRPTPEELSVHAPEFTIIAAPKLIADPDEDGTRTGTFIGIDLSQKMLVIIGTLYSGEVKKSIFTVMNYLLPKQGVMPMHCSANVSPSGESAIFFGLSGTGKTTLSADASRTLIGDDEHGWSDDGIFNFEGGCYAKTIKLSPEKEPEIYATTQMYGTILENVLLGKEDRKPDFNSSRFTENTRASYPISYIPNASKTGRAGHPKHILYLAADAFGVLPPLSKLTPEQAMYHFISGYTAKVAGTERDVTEPSATFSACFGAPFMPLHPTVYAELLADKIRKHGSQVWLVNTGWTGGPYGIGHRMDITYTRRLVNAVLDGELDNASFTAEPFFGFQIPTAVEGVPSEILNPRNTWADTTAYDAQAAHLAELFHNNFKKYAERASEDLRNAGPLVGH